MGISGARSWAGRDEVREVVYPVHLPLGLSGCFQPGIMVGKKILLLLLSGDQ